MQTFSISFVQEKKEGKGEDSSPLSLLTETRVHTGVFDGMGGAGASLYKDADGKEHTGAYIASRIVKENVEELLKRESDLEIDSIIPLLKEEIQNILKKENDKYQVKEKSSLRSSLLRKFPTTLAVCTCSFKNNICKIDSIWAGDSRNYLLTTKGLFQLSIDDLDPHQDPMENLKNDAPLSNCICADQDFTLNHKSVQTELPCCIISATDGCFGYSLSPMHFEKMLVESISSSKDINEWEKELCKHIEDITGDDFSFSAILIGYPDFKRFRGDMNNRLTKINKTLKKIENCQREISHYQKDIKGKEKKLSNKKQLFDSLIQKKWEEYKVEYMSKIL